MLSRARERLIETASEHPEHIVLLHADLLDLPLRARSFQTVLSMGMLHLFDAIDPLLAGFQRALQSDGQLFLSSLVRNNRLGDRYMRFLHRAGELAAPRSSEELERALNRGCEACGAFSVSGNMAYATCRAA